MKKKALNKLIKLLDLEQLEENLYRGQSENIGGSRVFGGQVSIVQLWHGGQVYYIEVGFIKDNT